MKKSTQSARPTGKTRSQILRTLATSNGILVLEAAQNKCQLQAQTLHKGSLNAERIHLQVMVNGDARVDLKASSSGHKRSYEAEIYRLMKEGEQVWIEVELIKQNAHQELEVYNTYKMETHDPNNLFRQWREELDSSQNDPEVVQEFQRKHGQRWQLV